MLGMGVIMKKINLYNTFKSEKGVTLVEVLLSIVLLGIIAGPLLTMVLTSFQNNSASRNKTEAVAFAEEIMSKIKAQKVISEGREEIPGIDNLFAETEIKIVKENGEEVSDPSEINFEYDPRIADNSDVELVISQNADGSISKIIFKDNNGTSKAFDNITRVIDFNLNSSGGSRYSCSFGASGDYVSTQFTPRSGNIVKLKITYENDEDPSGQIKPVNIDTNAALATGGVFQIYVIDKEKNKSGINFINKGTDSFEVNYMDAKKFDVSELDQLYKITVTVRNRAETDEHDENKVIYTTSSFVKK